MKGFQIFSKFQLADKASETSIPGVIVCEKGEAKGHGFFLGDKFLSQVLDLCKGKAVKVRVNHPEEGKPGNVLSIVGEADNFRMDGDKIRADIKLFDVPASKVISKLAQQASDLFGMSLDFVGKLGKKLDNGLKEIFCQAVNAVDFVESPAAASSLFSIVTVDSQITDMAVTIPAEWIKRMGLQRPDEKSILAAIENLIVKSKEPKKLMSKQKKFEAEEKKPEERKTLREHMEAFRKEHLEALEGFEDGLEAYDSMTKALAEAYEGKETPEEEKKEKEEGDKRVEAEAEEKKDEDEKDMEASAKIEATVKRLAAKEVTRLLSKIGVSAKGTMDTGTHKEEGKKADNEPKLTDEQKALAVQLKIDPKIYAEELKKAELAGIRL